MKLSIIIPVYNEEKTLLEILKKVQNVDLGKTKKEIILVDDFSTDNSRKILSRINENNIKVFYHKKNWGKGYAIRTGLKGATGDIVIIQDADLEYDPNDYKRLIQPIISGEEKVIYGSRFLGKKKKFSHFMFYLGGKVVTIFSNLLFGLKLTDEPTCYKVFNKKVLDSINLKCVRFEFCPEVTAKIAKKGIKIKEIPINYYPRSKNEGKKINWTDGFEAIWTLFKYRFTN
jgi:glycosyltransferase involved in cell wall biosynthesis